MAKRTLAAVAAAIVTLVSGATTTATASPTSAQSPTAVDAWGQPSADAGGSNFNPGETQLTASNVPRLRPAWSADAFTIAGSAIVNRVAYYTTGPGNTADHASLVAKNVATGATLWSMQLPLGTFNQPSVAGNRLLLSYYWAPRPTGNDLYGGLLAVDLTNHSIAWRAETGTSDTPHDVVSQNGLAFFGDNTHLRGYRVSDGKLLWSQPATSQFGPTLAMGSSVFANVDDHLKAFDQKTGRVLWSAPLAYSDLAAGPVAADGHVYIESYPYIEAFNATGCGAATCAPIWRMRPPGDIGFNMLLGGAGAGRLTVSWRDETVGHFHSLLSSLSAATGKPFWTRTVNTAGEPPMRSGNLIWLQTRDDWLESFSVATGAHLGTTVIPNANGYEQRAAVSDGTVLVDTMGTMEALRIASPTQHEPITGPGGKCVDVRSAGQADGTPVQLYTCNGTASQDWTNVRSRASIMAYGKCLDSRSGGTANGTKVQLWTCNSTNAQAWVPQLDGSLLNPASGKCLDDPRGSLTNGTQLQLYTCNKTASQRWKIANSIL
ncbi:putative pyrroloquinoline-quinone binding quinoprotein [Branchiibius hedensis]|uniref:PQQ-like domain-containing protein n=1 Tax=Branchiibius hedensis TaxID=672460 RepID=A0A2Y8ZRW9_9MICO|nr:ricin-type beta-trefoil lectin domain protein [Branchiibius hedensis]PWJ26318.1 putative pyrroloquinoline-quinone binding quinoprotein [Branchiibius hedensis]SSA35130.1 PQQ-like domain-containing protein [Branchiibius hedensis]